MLKSDKFGLKNIYYRNMSYGENKYIKELKQAVINRGFKEYSARGISSYFTFRYPVMNLTMFEDISRLDVGTSIIEDDIKINWRPTFQEDKITESQAIKDIKKLLIESIKDLVQNKQVIGVTLSGGLDSSLLLAMCRAMYPERKIYTYSCGFYGDDEFEYSRQVAQLFSDKHEEILLGKEDFIGKDSIMSSLIKHKCAPLHPNELALAVAERKAREDLCDIVLCGEGADDIFGGYGHNLRMFKTYDKNKEEFYDYIIRNYRYFSEEEREELLQPEFCINVEKEVNVLNEVTAPNEEYNKMLYFIQRLHTRGLIERGYNAQTYNGFGQGFPFINDELVEYANRLPFEMKVCWNTGKEPKDLQELSYVEISENFDITKYILKKVAEEYLPENIIYRSKKGFPVPFELWFKEDKTWNLDERVFKTKDISKLNGWKKFMVINLDMFIKIFNDYRID